MIGVFGMDCRAIWYTTCLTWTVTGLVGWLRYRHGVWRTKALTGAEPALAFPSGRGARAGISLRAHSPELSQFTGHTPLFAASVRLLRPTERG